eukprot:scaffold101056_cov66-Phaeocystis_antarctica.AAC.1
MHKNANAHATGHAYTPPAGAWGARWTRAPALCGLTSRASSAATTLALPTRPTMTAAWCATPTSSSALHYLRPTTCATVRRASLRRAPPACAMRASVFPCNLAFPWVASRLPRRPRRPRRPCRCHARHRRLRRRRLRRCRPSPLGCP